MMWDHFHPYNYTGVQTFCSVAEAKLTKLHKKWRWPVRVVIHGGWCPRCLGVWHEVRGRGSLHSVGWPTQLPFFVFELFIDSNRLKVPDQVREPATCLFSDLCLVFSVFTNNSNKVNKGKEKNIICTNSNDCWIQFTKQITRSVACVKKQTNCATRFELADNSNFLRLSTLQCAYYFLYWPF